MAGPMLPMCVYHMDTVYACTVHVGTVEVLEMCPQFRGVFMEGFPYKCVLS